MFRFKPKFSYRMAMIANISKFDPDHFKVQTVIILLKTKKYFSKHLIRTRQMKTNYLIIFLIFTVQSTIAQTILPAIPPCNYTLTLSGSPYIANSNITIGNGCHLTVNAGVEIKMAENTHLIVKGKVDFLGTASEPIYIHAKDTTWGNILLDSTTVQKSVFNYVNIQNGRRNVDTTKMPAVLFGYYSAFEIKNCHFENNLRCIYSYKCSDILIENCVLDSTNRGEKILHQYANQVVIDSCILFNTYGDADVIDFDGSTDIVISNNQLYGGGDDGIDLGHAIDPDAPDSIGCTNVTIETNVIYGMFNKAVSNGENAANINIHHNLMINCGWGIGAKAGAYVTADHNTIYKCRLGVKSYDHYDGWGPGHLFVSNSIIAGCDTTWVRDSTALLSVVYSLSDSTLISGTGNIQGDPLFVSVYLIPPWDSLGHLYASPFVISSSDFHLHSASPAIDSGDPAFAPDPNGSRTDMGALFYDNTAAIGLYNQPFEYLNIYPNPAGNTIEINSSAKSYGVLIRNSLGQVVYCNEAPLQLIDIGFLPGGIYYIELTGDNEADVKKIVKY